jgi:hypothetical protein
MTKTVILSVVLLTRIRGSEVLYRKSCFIKVREPVKKLLSWCPRYFVIDEMIGWMQNNSYVLSLKTNHWSHCKILISGEGYLKMKPRKGTLK